MLSTITRAVTEDELDELAQKENRDQAYTTLQALFVQTEAKVFLPLRVRNETVGCIIVGSKPADHVFTKDDIAMLDTLSKQAAIAIDNGLLYQDLQAKNTALEQLLLVQREFLDIASHELRTPISIIRGAASMVMKNEEGVLGTKEAVPLIYHAALRMNAIIDTLLMASRVDSATFAIQNASIQRLPLRQSIEKLIEYLQLGLREKHAPITLICDEHLTVDAEPKYLEIVLTNLIGNAIKYTRGVAEGAITVRGERDGKKVRIHVIDNGIGIPEQDQKRLFEKFSRASNAQRMMPDGTGLGLFIVRRIVEAHNGKCGFTSQEGKGADFWVEFKDR
jgi:signal transduction histidine kinase